ncbi:glycosyltransferase family 2 protein [Hymenobacter psychrotolerans]|uniref:Glycosyltransferase, GT2 family n=1 Tax=Hymenobacter psychrotolerans DSM 18569 TaxID=1121959 RepID=A0A1M6W4X0_9BACT|nr:glycosyltransferase family 2 protein [Hymenobacter psychrotolerans]SHK88777.1 Glycosyltransferase, GT2 family [Hymenobacter psychrotolerans DSM 18569]
MLCIVIPVFNRLAYTRACLDSLRAQTEQSFRVIVVDDGSTDGTAEALATDYPEVTVLPGTGSLFWTAGVNLGLRHALSQGASWLMTMNNDVVAYPDFVARMLEAANSRPPALYGAFELDARTRQPVYAGGWLNWRTGSFRRLLDDVPPAQRQGQWPTECLPGRGLLIPRAVFERIGLFAADILPHYYADYDFTHQARLAGFEVYLNFDACLGTYPDESGDQRNRDQRSLRNYYQHLFSIRGGANLRDFTAFARRNCPPRDLPLCLLTGYSRRLVGYFLK